MILNPSLGLLGAQQGIGAERQLEAAKLSSQDLRDRKPTVGSLLPQPQFPYLQRGVVTRVSPQGRPATQTPRTDHAPRSSWNRFGGAVREGGAPSTRACASRRGRALAFKTGRPGRGPRGARARARPLAVPESRATRARLADARGGAGAGL